MIVEHAHAINTHGCLNAIDILANLSALCHNFNSLGRTYKIIVFSSVIIAYGFTKILNVGHDDLDNDIDNLNDDIANTNIPIECSLPMVERGLPMVDTMYVDTL
jgi:hypothetical protein